MTTHPQTFSFTKMHGLGNDFLVTNSLTQDIFLTPALIRQWSDRYRGVGFDQLLLVEPPMQPQHDFRYRIFNADGSEVEQCGNGARCFAKYVYDQHLSTKTTLTVETAKGVIILSIEDNGEVRVNMGIPNFTPSEIPFINSEEALHYEMELEGNRVTFGTLSMGNPHAVICVENIKTAPVQLIGAAMQQAPCFPNKVNVGFMEIESPTSIQLRVYERGVGETLACGTGACAAVAYGIVHNKLAPKVQVSQPGGILTIEWAGKNQPLFMTGPAETVYQGTMLLPCE
jgi:diaminopimelate epimerase